VIVVGVDGGEVSAAQREAGVAFPGVGEAPDVGEFGVGVSRDEAEGAAGVGRGELSVVSDKQQFGAGRVGGAGECGEFQGAGHGGFVDDDELVLVEVPPILVGSQGCELCDESLVTEPAARMVGVFGGVLGLEDLVAALFCSEARGLVDPLGDVLGGYADGVGQDRCGGRRWRERDDRPVAFPGFPTGGKGGQQAGFCRCRLGR
jgi:hypothetical protein